MRFNLNGRAIAGVNVSRDKRVKEFVLLRGVTPVLGVVSHRKSG